MKVPVKKLKSGFSIPVLGLGTWRMGGKFKYNPENDDFSDINVIKKSIEMGIYHIDTAELYAEGYTETLVGRAIEEFDRTKLFIVSKVSGVNLRFKDVISSAENSLKRLKTDYLDLYLLHEPNVEVQIKETMRALERLYEEGKIKNIGVSNFGKKQFEEAQSSTKYKIVTNQVHYNLLVREVKDKEILDYCIKNDIILTAYRPLQYGKLADAYSIPVMRFMMQKYDKTPAQIALNWLISQDNVVAISKMDNLSQIQENLGAIGWNLNSEDIEKLRLEFTVQTKTSDVASLDN